jgi:hypothetical protein
MTGDRGSISSSKAVAWPLSGAASGPGQSPLEQSASLGTGGPGSTGPYRGIRANMGQTSVCKGLDHHGRAPGYWV